MLATGGLGPYAQALVTPTQLEQMLCGVEEPLNVQQLRVRARMDGFDKDFEDPKRSQTLLST